jgi:hypothetical protein
MVLRRYINPLDGSQRPERALVPTDRHRGIKCATSGPAFLLPREGDPDDEGIRPEESV